MSRVFGPKIRETRFFGTQIHQFAGEDHLIARSGYSGQGGFEIYVNGTDAALPLWDALMEAGRDRRACPEMDRCDPEALLCDSGWAKIRAPSKADDHL